MKRNLLISFFLLLANFSFGQTDHVVIAEIFGGGGNTNAPYLNDYIILYNPTGSSVDISSWSIQFAASGSNEAWFKTNLTGSIPAGSYYLIKELAGSTGDGVPIPFQYDLSDNGGVKPTEGKVALVNDQILLSGDPSPSDSRMIDYVGYGANASSYEGTGRAPAPGNTTSIRRKTNSGSTNYNYGSDGSGYDTDNNNNDFYVQSNLQLIPNYPLATTSFSNHILIADIYTGGGETGATFTNDYVVLFNSSLTDFDVSNWSLQYASSTGATWTVITLSGTIGARSYYLIELGSSGSNGDPVPGSPDVSNSSINISSSGKLAVVKNQSALSGTNPIYSNLNIIDFVGYSSTANGYEGLTGPFATSPGVTESIRRKDNNGNNTYGSNGSGWDANDNSSDFYLETDLGGNPPAPNYLADHLVIAEVYSGGGTNASSTYANDYVVLYNPSTPAMDATIDLSTWSIQRITSSTESWYKLNLTGSLAPDSYYLIQGLSGGGGGTTLPVTPNISDPNFNLTGAGSGVAIVNDQNLLTGIDDPNIVDFIGYGNVTLFEGSSPAPAPGVTQSLRRKDNSGDNTYGNNGSGWDQNNNAADFYVENDIAGSGPLPVELSAFSLSIVDEGIKLNWTTQTEVKNYGFDVERKTTSDEWEKIGFIHGYGNSNSPKQYSFFDENIETGKYSYRLKQIDTDGKFEYSKVIEINVGTATDFKLNQNYPNPFNPATTIRFELPEASKIKLVVYNILGQQVKTLINEVKEAGVHTITFNASDLNSGVYIYKLEAGSTVQIRKMTLIK